ncbi:serine/threonine-protein kinase [Catellatospora coxensis]|uniref:non-specific serine/threonine protein kinase n=1 Tax=Catellatospora coxensis TaxID=310354 RepID=A0A8J3KRT0_9ACTN|nr:hypothetical protein Cco03nite_04940 [Catellatospora coxensis]
MTGTATSPWQAGTLLEERYLLTEPAGRGGSATVWHASDERLGRMVAVKLLKTELLDDAALTRLQVEAQALARLRHRNIADVYDFGTAHKGGRLSAAYLVMELIDGDPLTQPLAGQRSLPWQQAAQVGAQTADGLAAAHSRGVVHRDIAPGNILLYSGSRTSSPPHSAACPKAAPSPGSRRCSSSAWASSRPSTRSAATTVTTPILITALATAAGILIVGVGGGLIRPMPSRWDGWLDRAGTESARVDDHTRAYTAGQADATQIHGERTIAIPVTPANVQTGQRAAIVAPTPPAGQRDGHDADATQVLPGARSPRRSS